HDVAHLAVILERVQDDKRLPRKPPKSARLAIRVLRVGIGPQPFVQPVEFMVHKPRVIVNAHFVGAEARSELDDAGCRLFIRCAREGYVELFHCRYLALISCRCANSRGYSFLSRSLFASTV